MLRQLIVRTLLSCGAATAAAQESPESLDEAWWTGPMLAPNAAALPQGHVLIEPYLYDLISNGHFDSNGGRHTGPYEHDVGTQGYALYGLTDRITAGMIPRFSYNEPAGEANSSGIDVGDVTLQAGYGLVQYHPGQRLPAISLVFQETVPSGRYDGLRRPSDGLGAGAWTSALALYLQDYLWMPNGRIVRVRLDLTYTVSSSVGLRDQSVYDTRLGFRGRAWPGDAFTGDAAAEYSLTRNWVLALDVVYQHSGNTPVAGSLPPSGGGAAAAFATDSGSSYSIAFAPAVEYNWSSRIGTLLGLRIIEIGRNTSASLTPAVAMNMVF
jgi:Putative MetA-pathway of phenol degradation